MQESGQRQTRSRTRRLLTHNESQAEDSIGEDKNAGTRKRPAKSKIGRPRKRAGKQVKEGKKRKKAKTVIATEPMKQRQKKVGKTLLPVSL